MGKVEKHRDSFRKYKSFSLPNRLNVLLVSNEISEVSGAAMVVRGGVLSDTEDAFGVNHLLEHMLFKGSENFRGDNEFAEFLGENGGENNAYTDMEYSMFSMTVFPQKFSEALQMFSEFFYCPLFNIASIEAELTAIENEFEVKRQNELVLLEHLKGHTAFKSHPFNRFGWGNRSSFEKHTAKDLQGLLFRIFRKLFVGGSMNLVVSSKHSLKVLEKMVTTYFSRIRRGEKLNREENGDLDKPIWPPGQLVRSKALAELDMLDIIWRIPPKTFDPKNPEVYLKRVLEHKGQGSLISFLKKKGWVISLDVMTGEEDVDGSAYDSTSFGLLFTIRLVLSTIGATQKFKIVKSVYAFLKLLGIQHSPHVMEEFKTLQDFRYESFDYKGPGANTLDLVELLSVNMLRYPVEKVVSGPFDVDVNSESSVKTLLTHFSPTNMRLHLVTKSFVIDSKTEIDPWFKLHYKLVDIPSRWVEKWSNIDPYLSFELPGRNEYLPVSLIRIRDDGSDVDDSDVDDSEDEDDEMHDVGDDGSEDEVHPDIDFTDEDGFIVINSSTRLRYLYSTASAKFNFCVKLDITSDPKSQASYLLFEHLLIDSFDNITYQSVQAGFETSLTFLADKICFSVSGFHETMHVLVKALWEGFNSFLPSTETFEIQKETYVAMLKRSCTQISYQTEKLMEENLFESVIGFQYRLDLLKEISCEDLKTFIASLRSKMLIDVVSFGDIKLEKVKKISKDLIAEPHQNKSPHIGLKHIQGFVEVSDLSISETESNSQVKIIYQVGCQPDVEHSAYLRFLCKIIEEHTFTILRNEERLGYHVSSHVQTLGGADHFVIQVTSSEVNGTILKTKILHYVDSVEEYLEQLSPSRFTNYKKATSLDVPSEGESLWCEVVENRCADFYLKVAKCVIKMTQAELQQFYTEYIKGSTRRVVVTISGRKEDAS